MSRRSEFKSKPFGETSLPESPDFTRAHSTYGSAYDLVRAAERSAVAKYNILRPDSANDVISARVVGLFMLELYACRDVLGVKATSWICEIIISAERQDGQDRHAVVFETGETLRSHLILAFRKSTPYDPPSKGPSRCSHDTIEDMMRDTLETASNNCDTTRKRATLREGFRCPVTGIFSSTWADKIPALLAHPDFPSYGEGSVRCCHILTGLTVQNLDLSDEDREPQTRHASNVLTILKCFGLEGVYESLLKSNDINALRNVMMLNSSANYAFDALDLWLEETGPNSYNVSTAKIGIANQFKHFNANITFRVHYGPTDTPLPSRELLALHAVVCRVAHPSGAAEYYNSIDFEKEEMVELAEDGSSAHVLAALLSQPSVLFGVARTHQA